MRRREYYSFEAGFQAYNARWKMPYTESGSTSNLYHPFEVAGVHVIMLGSHTDYDKNSDQHAWLKVNMFYISVLKLKYPS